MAGNKKPKKKYNPLRNTTAPRTMVARSLHNQAQNVLLANRLREFGALTIDERLRLKLPPHEAFIALRKGEGAGGSWIAVAVRVYAGLEVAKALDYTDEVKDDFQKGVDFLLAVRERAASQVPPVWSLTEEEAEQISLCLNATDELQDVTENEKRLDVLWDAFKKTDGHIDKFV